MATPRNSVERRSRVADDAQDGLFLQRFWLKLVPFVRHEVARVLIREHKDPVFCHRYPTGPCVGGNPEVRSARDTVASA